jgi:acyl-CoA thioester hydrolase
LVRQELLWKSPGRFDDVLDVHVRTKHVGNTSFTLTFEFRRFSDGEVLFQAETVYVVVDPVAGQKRPIPERHRNALSAGAAGQVVDFAAALNR